MRYNIISSSKKVLLIIAFMATALVGKVFAQTQKSYTSILRSDVHYYSSSVLGQDIKAGKLKLSDNVTELFWINRILDRWNIALSDGQVFKKGDTEIFQLSSGFTDLQDARDYIGDILIFHCRDFDATFKKGECKIGRAEEGRMNAITVDLDRDARTGEKITMLVPSSFKQVTKSDGNLPLIDGFSLYCLNDTEKVKAKKPDPVQPIVAVADNSNKNTGSILSPSNETTYKAINDGFTTTTTSAGGNTYISVNNTQVTQKDERVKLALINAGAQLLGIAANGFLIYELNEQQLRHFQQQTASLAYAPILSTTAPQIVTPTYGAIQGTAGTGTGITIQGNTGEVGYNPATAIQGNVGLLAGRIIEGFIR